MADCRDVQPRRRFLELQVGLIRIALESSYEGGIQVKEKYVYDFDEGNMGMKNLLGGKGANLAEMTGLGIPVPPGFTITTEACVYYSEHDDYPDGPDADRIGGFCQYRISRCS